MASDQSENDSRNRCAFVSLRNCSSELAALVAGGKLLQARAAATGNARSPREERRVDGTSSVVVLVERRRRHAGTSAGGCRLDKLALCRVRCGKAGHITGTGCARELATSGVPEAMGLYHYMF